MRMVCAEVLPHAEYRFWLTCMCYVTSKETETNRCPNAVYAAAHNETCFACAQSKEGVDICAVLRTKLIRKIFHQAADEIRWIVINHASSAT
jgi:hypothetical protein